MEEGHGHWREKHLFRSWFYSVKCTVFVMLKYPFQSEARFQLRPVHAKSGVGGNSLGQVSKSSKVHRQQFTGQKWKQEKYRSRNYSAHSDNRWSRLRLLCHFQWHGDLFWISLLRVRTDISSLWGSGLCGWLRQCHSRQQSPYLTFSIDCSAIDGHN